MWFTSKIFQGTKMSLAAGGTIMSSLIIGYGAVASSGGIFIFGGTFFLISSLFHFFDSSKVARDVRKEIGKLTSERKLLKGEVENLNVSLEHLDNIRNKFEKSHELVTDALEEANEQVEELQRLSEQGKNALEHEKKNNREMKERVQELLSVKEMFESTLNKTKREMEVLEQIKTQYCNENNRLQTSILDLNDNKEELEGQVKQLKEQMVRMLKLLADTRQVFSDALGLKDELTSTVVDFQNIETQMRNILDIAKNKKFVELDTNEDGVIDQEEFQSGMDK